MTEFGATPTSKFNNILQFIFKEKRRSVFKVFINKDGQFEFSLFTPHKEIRSNINYGTKQECLDDIKLIKTFAQNAGIIDEEANNERTRYRTY